MTVKNRASTGIGELTSCQSSSVGSVLAADSTIDAIQACISSLFIFEEVLGIFGY
jgi:hypothetical protein